MTNDDAPGNDAAASGARSSGSLDLPDDMFRSGDNPTAVEVPFEKRLVGTVFRNVQATTINGRLMFEGDIMLGEADKILGAPVAKSITRTGEQFRWPGGVV